jgi:hypothetical protein
MASPPVRLETCGCGPRNWLCGRAVAAAYTGGFS